mgnify:FL=1
MEACKRYYSVKYVRVPDLLLDLQEARDEGRFKDALKKYTNPTLLILDEWLLMRVTEKDSANLLSLFISVASTHPRSSVPSILRKTGTKSLVVRTTLSQMPSWIESHSIHTRFRL